jgi:predicted AAA+ superfamily ATPase
VSKVDGTNRDPEIAKLILRSYSRNICTLADNRVIIGDVNSNHPISETTYYDYIGALKKLYIIDDLEAWCPAIRSKSAIRSGVKRNLVDPSIAVAALGASPEYFAKDFKTLGFLFESLCIRDLKVYSSSMRGSMSYYHDRYGLEADGVLNLEDGRYALLEFKLGESEVPEASKHLCEIEKLIIEYNKKEKQCPLRLPDLKIIVTGTQYGYKDDSGVFVIPLACLKN